MAGIARTPWLESFAARVGVLVLVILSSVVGCSFWLAKGEWQLAVLTLGAELVAFAGLALARHHWGRSWGLSFGALLVTALAAAWCGLTLFQKIDADTRAAAIAAAQQRPAYLYAERAAKEAETVLSAQIRTAPPYCTCPDTIRAWEASQSAAVARLTLAREDAIKKLEATLPPVQTDWFAIIRGVGVEAAKLLGFMVFGVAVSSGPKKVKPVARKQAPPKRAPNVVPLPTKLANAAKGAAAGFAALFPFLHPAPAEAHAEPVSAPTESTVAETDDGTSIIDMLGDSEPEAAPTRIRKTKPRGEPPSYSAEKAVQDADRFVAKHGRFSARRMARVPGHPSFATIIRGLDAARAQGLLNDRAWAAQHWLKPQTGAPPRKYG